ncbi:MAG: DUF4157 domain-containing protein [Haliscomenobacteraceae bacterium CHB4]|nr:DUF4157 domain-containing protein [Haliscomenobacteraceae bacterium CHB4]
MSGPEQEPLVQRMCAECATEEENAASDGGAKEEPDIQTQTESSAPTPTASPDLQSRLDSTKGGGQPLPEDTRSSMESGFGADFSGVRVHTDSESVQMNKELGAHAFTHGSDIYFNEGKYDTGSTEGKKLLAHELTHTVQQGGSAVAGQNVSTSFAVQRQGTPDAKESKTNEEKPEPKPIPDGNAISSVVNNSQGISNNDREKKADSVKGSDKNPNSIPPGTEVPPHTSDSGGTNPTNNGKGASSKDASHAGEKLPEKNKESAEDKSPDEKVPVENEVIGGVENTGVGSGALGDNVSSTGTEEGSAVSPGETGIFTLPEDFDIKTAFGEFKTEAKRKKTAATKALNGQIDQIKKTSVEEREKVKTSAEACKKTISESYDKTIARINREVLLAISRTFISYYEQRERIRVQKNLQLANLENETNKRVETLKKEGERIAKSAEKHGSDEEIRINKWQFSTKVFFDNLIEQQVKTYNVPEREERMRERLGALRDESMEIIGENNTELIAQVKEDSSDLAERIRDEYAEAAEDLPSEKILIKQSIEFIADNALDEISGILLDPLVEMKKNADELVAQLKAEKTTVLKHVDDVEEMTINEISSEEELRINELNEELGKFNRETDEVITDVEDQIEGLPDILAAQLIDMASNHIELTQGTLINNAKRATGNLKKVFDSAAKDAVDNIIETDTRVTEANDKTTSEFAEKAEKVSDTLTSAYTKIADKASTDMGSEVMEYLKQLDQTVSDSVKGWENELAEGKKEITAKVDEVLEKNQEIKIECIKKIWIEAHQVATEYEVTYYLRRTAEGIEVVLGAIWWLVKWIVKIIVAIILIILVVFIIYLIIEALATVIANLIRRFLPALYQWLRTIIMRFVWPALQWAFRWLAQLVVRFFKSTVVRFLLKVLTVYFGVKGLQMIWEGIVRQDIPMSKRKEMVGEGFFLVGTSVLAEWKAIQSAFRLTKGFAEFKKIAALLGDAKLASKLVNAAKGDFVLSLELAQTLKPAQLRNFLLMTDDAVALKNTLVLFGNDALRLENALVKCENLSEFNTILAQVRSSVDLAEKLLGLAPDGKNVLILLKRVPNPDKLAQLLEITPDLAKLSDEALSGLSSMSEAELLALKGKNIAEIESAFAQKTSGTVKTGKSIEVLAAKLEEKTLAALKNQFNQLDETLKQQFTDDFANAPNSVLERLQNDNLFEIWKNDLRSTSVDELLAFRSKVGLRTQYINAVNGLEAEAEILLSQREPKSKVAEILFNRRRAITIEFKNATPDDLLEWIFKFNDKRYTQTGFGDKWGMTWEGVIKKYGTDYDKIIKAAATPLGDKKQLGDALFKAFGADIKPILDKYRMFN